MDNEKCPYSKVTHGFDTGLATKYGMECAVIIHHFSYWIDLNRRKEVNFKEGKTWTYQTIKDIADHFPYLSHKQVERIINKLIEYEILVKGNFNSNPYDRTAWYAFKDEIIFSISRNREIEKPKSGNPKDEIGKSIKDTITDIKKDTLSTLSNETPFETPKSHECVSFFLKFIQEKDPAFKLSKTDKLKWAKDLQAMHEVDGRSWDEIFELIVFAQNHEFWPSRSNTTKKLRKNATSIAMQMKQRPIKDNAESKEIDRQALIEKNSDIARKLVKGIPPKYYLFLSDGLKIDYHRIEFRLDFDHPTFENELRRATDKIKEELGSLGKM